MGYAGSPASIHRRNTAACSAARPSMTDSARRPAEPTCAGQDRRSEGGAGWCGGLGLVAERDDVLGEPLVVAVQEVVAHVLREPAGLRGLPDGLRDLADQHRRGTAADADV